MSEDTKSLLEKARQLTKRVHDTGEAPEGAVDVAMAWLKDEITGTAASTVLGTKGNGGTYRILNLLKKAYREGRLIEGPKP